MNLIDKAIAAVSPAAGYKRARFRAMMSAASHYDAASNGRRTAGWKAVEGDVNVSIRGGRLRALSRDMVRNNAIASRAVDTIVNNVIGDGVIPSIECDDPERKKQILDVLLRHVDGTFIDRDRKLNLYGIQRLAMRSIVEAGECLMRKRTRRPQDRLPLMMQVELLEPEFFDEGLFGKAKNGNEILDGIEVDIIGRRVAYHLFDQHPAGDYSGSLKSNRVPVENVIHAYEVKRPGQRRGVPWMAPVMSQIQDAYDYADAQLLRQKIAAMWVGFTRSMDDADDGYSAGSLNIPDLVPGMFEHLPPGRDVTWSNPPKADGYAEHMKAVQRMIASAMGLTYEALSGDLEGVNFSSGRMGRLEMNRAMSAVQWCVVIPQICEPLADWLREAIDLEVGVGAPYRIKWTPPRFQMVDPTKEIPALNQQVRSGFTSRQRVIRELGYDPEMIEAEIAEDNQRADAAGFEFDSDSRSDMAEVPETEGDPDDGS